MNKIICIMLVIIIIEVGVIWMLNGKDKNIEQEVITTTIEDSLYTKYNNMNMIKVNFDNLLQINNDTKGWIMVPGTNVNYPFVQSNDNLYSITFILYILAK